MALDASPRPSTDQAPGEEPLVPEPWSGRPPRRHRPLTAVWLALELLRTLRSLALLGAVLLIVLLAINFTSSAGQLSQRLSGAWLQTQQGFASVGQVLIDAFNPTHPPRYPISQDTEFSSLSTVRVGDNLGDSGQYQFRLAAIRRRDAASGKPDFAQYALLQRQYKVPRETKVFGFTVYVDRGEQQYVLDRGVTFRIGKMLYKVNWISGADQQLAAATYRNPDQFAGTLAFDSD